MFKRLNDGSNDFVTIFIEDRPVRVPANDTVAAALLTEGVAYFRTTPTDNSRRAPFCMMGTCFECLVEIDGVSNQQACQMRVRQGMTVKLQKGARRIEP